MSYSQSEDAVEGDLQCICLSIAAIAVTSDNILFSGHGSVFRGEVGNGEGRIKVFAPSGSDISLQLT
jgi:hypothetical protein